MPNIAYTVTLNDYLSKKLHEAFAAASSFEHKLDELKEKAKGLGEGIGKGMQMLGLASAAYEIGEFIHKGVEAYHTLEVANSQLEAGLESTKNASGMTMASLDAGVEKFNETTTYSRGALKDMQAQLLTFPAITKETFNQTSQAVLDMAARTHHGVNELAIMVGKAMQDPIKGITAMKRVGVNFSEGQKEMVKHMVATGHAAQAQKFILSELATEYGGSAKAAFDADPGAKFKKTMETVELAVGKAAEELITYMAPALTAVAKGILWVVQGGVTFSHWLTENTEYIKAAGIAIGILATGWLLLNAGMIGSTIAGLAATAMLWLLDAAAAANPIGILVIAVAALAAGLYLAYTHCAPLRAAISGIGALFSYYIPIVKGFGEVLWGAFTLNPRMVAEGVKDSLDSIKAAASAGGVSGIFGHAYDSSIAASNKESTMGGLVKKKEGGELGGAHLPGGAAGSAGAGKGKKESVTGQKNYTINIKIENLVKDFRVQTTNLTEGASKVKEMVAAALISAVQDSQLVGGQ